MNESMSLPTGAIRALMDDWVAFVTFYWNEYEVPVLSGIVHRRFGYAFAKLGMRAVGIQALLSAHRMVIYVLCTSGRGYYIPVSRWDELSTSEQDYLLHRMERGLCRPVPKRFSAAAPAISTPIPTYTKTRANVAGLGPIQFVPGKSMRDFDTSVQPIQPLMVPVDVKETIETFDVGALPVPNPVKSSGS
jgi:hypothetical protein